MQEILRCCILLHKINANKFTVLLEYIDLLMVPNLFSVMHIMLALSRKTFFSLRMFHGLVIIIKNFTFINSRRPWLPNSISHLFILAFLSSWPLLFYTRVFWLRYYICSYIANVTYAKILAHLANQQEFSKNDYCMLQ